MSTNLHRYTLFSAFTLFTLGGLQIPAIAASNEAIFSSEQKATVAPFYVQGSVRLAQAAGNCRMIKNGGGIFSDNSRGTGGKVLPQGTLVEVNFQNVVGSFIQVDKVGGRPRVGFVDKSFLTSCASPPTTSQPTDCFRVRNLAAIANQGGLPLRQEPSIQSQEAFSRLEVGQVFRATNPLEVTLNQGIRWIKIAPTDDRVGGFVSDGPTSSPVRNLESASCTGVK